MAEVQRLRVENAYLKNFKEANEMIDLFLYLYNDEHIRLKDGAEPLSLRSSA